MFAASADVDGQARSAGNVPLVQRRATTTETVVSHARFLLDGRAVNTGATAADVLSRRRLNRTGEAGRSRRARSADANARAQGTS